MVTDSKDSSAQKSLDYVVHPVVSLPETRSFIMEVDEEPVQATLSPHSSPPMITKDDDEVSMGDEYEYDGAEDMKVLELECRCCGSSSNNG
jgi:hypothetical protein